MESKLLLLSILCYRNATTIESPPTLLLPHSPDGPGDVAVLLPRLMAISSSLYQIARTIMFMRVLITSRGWQTVTDTNPATSPQKNSLIMTVVVVSI